MKYFLATHIAEKEGTNDRFFDLLEQHEFTTALLHTLDGSRSLQWVASSVLVSSTSSDVLNNKKLARAVFLKVDKERPRATDGTLPGYTLSSFRSTLADVRSEFRLLKTRANAYLNHQPVKDWLQGIDNEHADLPRRRSAINNVWTPKTSALNHRYSSHNHWIWHDIRGVTPYQLLLGEDFDRLLRIHKFYMNYRPWDWHFVPEVSN